MKSQRAVALLKKAASFLISLTMLVGMVPAGLAESADNPLKPADLTYDSGNIVLHKQAERVGPDEWKITVRASISEKPIVRQSMEVVFVVDASGSMAWCTDEEAHAAGSHSHSSSCYSYTCGMTAHSHSSNAGCYGDSYVCGMEAHTHRDENGCYEYTCGGTEHEHDVDDGCYEECNRTDNPTHYNRQGNRYTHKTSGTDCVSIRNGRETKYYTLICDEDEHTHDEDCENLICQKTAHTHSNSCREVECDIPAHSHTDACRSYTCGKDACTHSKNGKVECTYTDENGDKQSYKTRLQASKDAIGTMVANLQSGDYAIDVTFKYVVFSGSGYENGVDKTGMSKVVSDLDDLIAEGGTYMYDGISVGIDQFSTNGASKKVLVVLTDGAHNDDSSAIRSCNTKLDTFKNAEGTNGTVFTIGFAYANDTLAGIAGNGGSYIHAGDDVELTDAMENIESSITAMLVDPMGSTVGFNVGSIQKPTSSVEGSVTYADNTIFWNPVDETEFRNATIEYSYTVKLNGNAALGAGKHEDVPLNKPTSLLYGIKNDNGTEMKEAAFPIPEAKYGISSVQVNWKYGNTNIKTPTDTESIIADYNGPVQSTGGYYTPEFVTDYETITDTIPQSGHNVYHYTGTTITRNGTVVDAVDPADTAAYVVTHNYELAEMYDVTYEYTGTVPEGAPEASENNHMAKPKENVAVAVEPALEGYKFSGWEVSEGGASISGGSFVMPSGDVKLVGSWEKLPAYQVKANYFTCVDGGEYVQDNDQPVELTDVIYTDEGTVQVSFADGTVFGGNTYGGAVLADGSAAAVVDNDGLLLTGITPADPAAVVVINLYREVTNPAQYKVNHVYYVVDPDGVETLVDADGFSSELIAGTHGDSVAAADVAAVTVGASTGDVYEETGRSGDIVLDKGSVKEITITYKRYEYRVTTEGDEGVQNLTEDKVYKAGEDAEVSYSIKEGYELVSVTVDGADKTGDASALKFADIAANHHVVVVTQKSEAAYKVNHVYYVVDPDGVETLVDADGFSSELIAGTHGDSVAAADVAAVTAGASTGDVYEEAGRSADIVLSKDEVKEITITYKRYEYRVTTEGDEGVQSLTEDKAYKAGEDAEVSYSIRDGYELVSVIVDGADKTGDASALKFADIAANHHVVVVTQKSEAAYKVNHVYYVVDPDGVETLVVEDGYTTDSIGGKHGDSVAAADVAAVTAGASTGDVYEEAGRSADIVLSKDEVKEITITYKRYEYRVTIAGDEGVQSLTEDKVYKAGEDAEVSYSIKEGYELVSVTVDGADKTGDASALKFADIAANHHVVVVTQKSEAAYRVNHVYYVVDPDGVETLVDADGYTTDAIGGKHGDSVAAADVAAVTAGASTGDVYEETGRSGDIVLSKDEVKEITITYKRYEYRVTTEGDEGVQSLTEDKVYKAGEDAEVSYSIRDGYELVSVTVDGADKTGDASALKFADIAANHHVVVVTQKSEAAYKVNHVYYVVDPDGVETLVDADGYTTDAIGGKHGDSVAAADVAAVTAGASTGDVYEETGRSGDIVLSKDEVKEITITYKRYEYRVTTEGDEGVQSLTEDKVYKAGEDAEVSYSIKEGYELVSVTVDGADKTGDASALKFADIAANHHVVVVTQKSEAAYKVNHVYYVVDPDGVETLVAEDGYTTDAIGGKHGDSVAAADVAAVTAGASTGDVYEETGRSGDIVLDKGSVKEITITYKRYEYRVTIAGDEGVTIAKDGGTYRKGTDVSVGYAIKDGYELVSVTVNGAEVPAAAARSADKYQHTPGNVSFSKIDANHAVVVTTRKLPAYRLYVRYVFEDGSTHVGYSGDYAFYDEIEYRADSAWTVVQKVAPEGYAFVAGASGEMSGENHDVLSSTVLSGEAFGAADKYVTLTYAKRASYWIVANYFTINGETTVKDNENYVGLKNLTYTEETSVDYDFSQNKVYGGNEYGLPKIGEETTGGTPSIENFVLKGIVPNGNTAFVVVNLYRDITPEEEKVTPTPTPTPTPKPSPTPTPVPEGAVTPAPTANKYNAPPTGDGSLLLWSVLALMSCAAMVLVSRKMEKNKG